MKTKITVNGVTYDGVDAMPPDVRHTYDLAMANVPDLADRDGDGVPDIVQGAGPTPGTRTAVRKLIVNGTTYESEEAMPPDVRAAYERAKAMLSAGQGRVQRTDIKLSFQLTGPGFKFGKSVGGPAASRSLNAVAGAVSSSPRTAGTPTPGPIEPASSGGGLRLALILGACAAGGLMLLLLARAR